MLTVQSKSGFFASKFPRTRRALLGSVLSAAKHVEKKANALPLWLISALNVFLTGIIGISIVVAAILVVPAVYYFFFPAEVVSLETPEVKSLYGGEYTTEQTVENKEEYQYMPEYDETLPEGNWISIPLIGVKTELRPTENPEEALEKGVWWVPDFGKPGDGTELPMIVAAHRFGWQWWWQTDYWKYNSFYLLPETQPGDRVEIIIDKRKWEYEIYAGEEGDEITDYHADLILYTCKYLQSPVRHFRYARLIDPTTDTQNSLE